MKTRLRARNISGRVVGWSAVTKLAGSLDEDFFLENKIELRVELSLVGRADQGRALPLESGKRRGRDVERDDGSEDRRLLVLGRFVELGESGLRFATRGIGAVGEDQEVARGPFRRQEFLTR